MPTIEAQYQTLRVRKREDARRILHSLVAIANMATLRVNNLGQLHQPAKRKRLTTLERAISRMHVDDLDAAWQAALRGDLPSALLRVADHVTEAPVELQGTPWRLTGWLSKR
jgi:hypothetical protein